MDQPSQSTHVNVPSPSTESLSLQLRRLWEQGQRPEIRAFLAAAGNASPAQMVAALDVDQWQRWQQGDQVPAEEYLRQFPVLDADPEYGLQLVYGEFLLREQLGERPDVAAFAQRFPQYAARLRLQIELHRAMASTPRHQGTRTSAAPATAVAAASADFGRYRLGSLHARGGLGEVYVAEDEELRRSVAFKRIRPEKAADPQLRRRFLAEAELTAKLEHPGIVPIYGLVHGTDGQPYYAMRFIEGESLAETIKRWHDPAKRPATDGLSFRALLQRFISVCQTMAYAHSKHIIHRDLKPANVMLGKFGETLVVDWGLAKDVTPGAPPSTDETTLVESTADFRPSTLDDRLYTQAGQALGTPAFMSPEQAAGHWERVGPASDIYSLGVILYVILTGQVPLQAASWPELQQRIQRGDFPPPHRVHPAAPRPLSAACLKAMAVKPEDRYAGAADLATDVEHWLADEPVDVYVEPWTVRAGRFARRNRGLVGSGIGALVLGMIALAVIMVLMNYQRELLDRKNADLEAGNSRERSAKQRAQNTLELVVNDEMMEQFTRQRPEYLTPDRRQLLGDLAAYYQQFAQENAVAEAERHRQAKAYFRIARLLFVLGRVTEAEEAYRRALPRYEQLVAEFPTVPEYRERLAAGHGNLGVLLSEQGKRAEAEAEYHQALTISDKLATDFSAESRYRQQLGGYHMNLGNLLAAQGKGDAAEAAYGAALTIQQKLVADFPDNPGCRNDLAMCQVYLSMLLSRLGKRVEAEATCRQAIAVMEKLVAEFPGVVVYQQDLAGNHYTLGNMLGAQGKFADAEAAHRQALAIREKLAAAYPAVPAYRQDLANSQNSLGRQLASQRKYADAEAAYRRAVAIQEKLVADFPTVTSYQGQLAASYVNLAHLLGDTGQPEASLRWYAKAIALLEPLLAHDPRLVTERLFLRNAHAGRAIALAKLMRHAESAQDWAQVADLDQGPQRLHFRCEQAFALARAADHAAAVKLVDEIVKADAANAGDLYDLGCVCSLAAAAVKDDTALRERYAARAVQLLRQAVGKGFKDIEHLKKDDDLQALRLRADFMGLVNELENPKKPCG